MVSSQTPGPRRLRERIRRGRFTEPIVVAGSLIVLYAAVRATGGAPNPLTHLAYVVVGGAAVTTGLRGGSITGLAVGVLFGPLMPLTEAGSSQFLGQWAWLVRLITLTAAGLVVGGISERSERLAGSLRVGEERRRGEAAIRASEARLRDLVEASPAGIVVLDEIGRVTIANSAVERLLGTSPTAIIGTAGQLSRRVITPNGEVVESLGRIARRALRSGASLPPLDLIVDLPAGERIVVAMEVNLLWGPYDRTLGAAITLRDVTAERALEGRRRTQGEDLQRVARLAAAEPTARAACERLIREFAPLRPVVSSAIYTFSGDGANRLAELEHPDLSVRQPARASGAEAAHLRRLAESGRPVRVALESVIADPSFRAAIAHRGCRAMVIVPLLAEDELLGVLLAADSHDPARILDEAEIASLTDLGQILAAVVQRALLEEQTAASRARERVGLILERPELLVPAFQPIVSLEDGRVAGYEALSRFEAEPSEPPNVWFARAESVELGSELQALAIHRALTVAAARELPDRTFLSVNASPHLLADPLLVRATADFPLERIVIEITEEEAISDYALMRHALEPYRAAGARVAIDDLGAGYASLRHLTELQPDFIKLDALLMPRLADNPAGKAMIRALSGFAEEIGAVLIAEGVERPEDLALLASAPLPILVQGFAIARPGPAWPEILPTARQAWSTTGSPGAAAAAWRRPVAARDAWT